MAKQNLLNLLNSIDAFVVPTIQRDYAQGRDKGSNKALCEEVRTSLIESLYRALVNGEKLVLDYIYGASDEEIFYPIDGQQRLTTLFLLHWYLGKKEGIDQTNQAEFDLLRKFSYQIRDTSKEFCNALIDIDVDFSLESIASQIKDSSRYHDSYSMDPSVWSMLVVLDAIHNQFKSCDIKLWDRLKDIEFWGLSLEQFGLTDDLFVKMNARGKRLTRFDVFKSDLESTIEKAKMKDPAFGPLIEEWKREIDNSFLDAYWNKFGFEYSERNLFRTILFINKALIAAENTDIKYDESWETNESNVFYNDVIAITANQATVLKKVCNLLSNFNVWESAIKDTQLFIDSSTTTPENIPGYIKARVFGILYWFSFKSGMSDDSDFKEFERILDNYILSLRQFNIKPRNYSSAIDNTVSNAAFIGKVFNFIKRLVDGYNGSAINDFYEYLKITPIPELKYEIEKLKYSNFYDIVELERIPYIKGNINNIFFDNTLYLNASQVSFIFDDEDLTNKFIRIVISHANDEYGLFQKLLLDKITQESGKKQLYYKDQDDKATAYFHKIIFNSNATFGDNILTARGSDQYGELARCVKESIKLIAKEIASGYQMNEAINNVLDAKLAACDFINSANIKWYIVKYEEFFYNAVATSLSVLRRKNYGGIDDDNIYDIQCLGVADNNFADEHYNPFYLGLCHKLNNHVVIDEASLKFTGVHIEYLHPCTLSNGWTIKMAKDSNWIIDFHGNIPLTPIADLTINSDGLGIIDCHGCDSIDKAAMVINSI